VRSTFNPYTGWSGRTGAPFNPYTGWTVRAAATYNPYTGRYVYGYRGD
jgi:hypothetical protein